MSIFAALLMLSPELVAAADDDGEMQTIAVFSFSGYQRFAADLEYLGRSAGNPNLPLLIGNRLKTLTDIEQLKGLESTQAFGAAIATDGLVVAPLLFLPVTNIQELLASLEPLIGPAHKIEDDLWKIGREDLTGYVRVKDGWAYVAQTPETLAWLPEPDKLLGDLPKRYDSALQLNLQRVPEVFRTMAVDLIRLTMQKQLPQREGETEAGHALRAKLAQWRFAALEQALVESRQITLGWSLDDQTRETSLEVTVKPLPESGLARRFASLQRTQTHFAGLAAEDSPLQLHVTLELNPQEQTAVEKELRQTTALVQQVLGEARWLQTPQDRQVFQELTGALSDVIQATAKTGRLDLGLAARNQEAPLTLLGAIHVGRGAVLEEVFESLAARGEQDPRFSPLELDVAKIDQTRVHAVKFAQQTESQALKKLLGGDPRLLAAFQQDALWLAVGPDALSALQASFTSDQRGEVAPVQLELKLAVVARILSQAIDDSAVRPLLALAGITLSGGDDRVLLSLESNKENLRLKITAKEGVIRAGGLALGLRLAFGG